MNTKDKLEIVTKKMKMLKITILVTCETKRNGAGNASSDNYKSIHSRGENCQIGVAIVMDLD